MLIPWMSYKFVSTGLDLANKVLILYTLLCKIIVCYWATLLFISWLYSAKSFKKINGTWTKMFESYIDCCELIVLLQVIAGSPCTKTTKFSNRWQRLDFAAFLRLVLTYDIYIFRAFSCAPFHVLCEFYGNQLLNFILLMLLILN